MLTRLLSLILILYLMILSWVPQIVFHHQQVRVRKEMKTLIKNGVPENKRLLFYDDELTADAVNLKWIHDWEFQYKGEMYDILKKEVRNGRLVYTCIHDVKESGLFAKLDEMVDKQMQSNAPAKEQRKLFQNFFTSLYFLSDTKIIFNRLQVSGLFAKYLARYQSVFILPDIPPPKM
jgi:hypothetical protein